MSALQVGDKYKVWIQKSDGMLIEVDAFSLSLEHSMLYDGVMRSRLEMEIINYPLWQVGTTYAARVSQEKQAPEWQCDYCKRPNDRQRKVCQGCGAVRSFIYLA